MCLYICINSWPWDDCNADKTCCHGIWGISQIMMCWWCKVPFISVDYSACGQALQHSSSPFLGLMFEYVLHWVFLGDLNALWNWTTCVNVMLCFFTTHCSLRLIVRSELDVSTFATRRLHACHHARAPNGGRWNCGREMSGNFAQMPTSTLHLGIFYMPYSYDMGPTALLPLRRKVCWGLFCPKNPTASAGCEPTSLGTKGQHATSRVPKPLHQCK